MCAIREATDGFFLLLMREATALTPAAARRSFGSRMCAHHRNRKIHLRQPLTGFGYHRSGSAGLAWPVRYAT